MTLKDIIIAGKLTISEGGGGGGAELDALIDRSIESVTTQATTIGTYAFRECTALKTFSAPNATLITQNALENCYALESLTIPEVTNIQGSALQKVGQQATTKAIIVLPKLETLGTSVFRYGGFAAVDIGPNCASLPNNSFYTNVASPAGKVTPILILRRTAGVVTAGNGDAINGVSDVYVPSALISSYTSASNWSTKISGGFITLHAIEGSIYETQYADGTPIAS